MLVPLSWLRDFTPLDDDVSLLTATLNALGLVVEGVELVGRGLEGVVVGRVLEVRPHPDADLVRLAEVDLGTGDALQIGCAAANLAVGQHVPVATIGSILPNGMTIERRKLRGEWSSGMICGEDELGLVKERADGIMVLPEGVSAGTPFAQAMGIAPDVVFDLAIENNRPDAMCIAGVARDLAAKLDLSFAIPDPEVVESGVPAMELASVAVERSELAPRFTARVLSGVRVGPSPELIARRLTLSGMRPINNVVDASNYVMLELGQPSHPYDLSLLEGRGLRVRSAQEGEQLVTLDGRERTLSERDVVICDMADNLVGLAGIMGSESSEIRDTTEEILLEAAVWNPYVINYTSRRLALRTDASARFERRVDSIAVERATARFCELVQQSSPDAVVAPGQLERSLPPEPSLRLNLRTKRVNEILGTTLNDGEIRRYLAPLGFYAYPISEGVSSVTVPSFRPDSEAEIDLIEEVARMHGYENIPRTVPTAPMAGHLSLYQRQRRSVRRLMLGLGITEAWTSSLLGFGDLRKAGLSEAAVELVNPIAIEETLLRTSMLPGMLRAISLNFSRRNTGVRLFEIGHVFGPPPEGRLLPDERERLAVVLAMNDDAKSAARIWNAMSEGLHLGRAFVEPTAVAGLHPGRSAELRDSEGYTLGVLGEVDPHVLSEHGIGSRVGWIEVDLPALLALVEPVSRMRPISRFPAAEFDLAFVVEEDVPAGAVEATLRESLGVLVEEVGLFDVFRSEQLESGKKSLAFRLRLAALDRTLDEKEVAEARVRAINAVKESNGGSLRE